MEVYGWFGSDYANARGNQGQLTSTNPPNIQYYTYDQEMLAAAVMSNRLDQFTFGVDLIDAVPVPPGGSGGDSMLIIIIGVVCVVVIVALCTVMVIVIVCVVGKRRRDSPKRKRCGQTFNLILVIILFEYL